LLLALAQLAQAGKGLEERLRIENSFVVFAFLIRLIDDLAQFNFLIGEGPTQFQDSPERARRGEDRLGDLPVSRLDCFSELDLALA
jgi:hypothetical protein